MARGPIVALLLLATLFAAAHAGKARFFVAGLYPATVVLSPLAGGKNITNYVLGGTSSNYFNVSAGDYWVGSQAGVQWGSLTPTNTSSHTIVWWQLNGTATTVIAADTFNDPAAPTALIRGINVLPDYSVASIVLNTGWSLGVNENYPTQANQPRGSASAYLAFPPSHYNVDAWDVYTNSLTPLEDLYAVAGHTYTIIAGKRYLGPNSVFILEDDPAAGGSAPVQGDYHVRVTSC